MGGRLDACRPTPAPTTLLGAALVALFALGLLVGPLAGMASAHASLVDTEPYDGQVLDDPPPHVTWTFNEQVTVSSGALRVYDASGERVDTGEQSQPGSDQARIRLPDRMRDGTYVATFRVTSADGHVVRGASLFAVGQEDTVDDDTLAALFAGGGDTALGIVASGLRTADYLGVLLLGGALLWGLVVARGAQREVEGPRAVTWARRGAVITGVAAALTVPLHAMLTTGLGVGALTTREVMTEAVTSSVGVSAGARFLAATVALLLLARATRPSPLALGVGTVALGSHLLAGHTRTVEPGWVMWLGDASHLLAGAAWFGGLILLAQALRARQGEGDALGAADLVKRFSTVATWSIVVVTLAGLAMSWVLVRQPRALTTTEYGWTFVVKVALVAVVLLVGLYNNRRLVPAIQHAGDAAWNQLRGTVRFEVGVLVGVLAVTGVLVNLRPAAEAAGITAAFDTLVAIDEELQLNLVVDPNRVGHNEIHLYVLDRTGRPVSDLDSLTLLLSQPDRDIGPLERTPFVAGAGHWQLDGRDLAVPGDWVIELVVGIDRFSEARVAVPIVVNP